MSAASKWASPLPDPRSELDSAFEHSPMGLAQCLPQGDITAVNPALDRMLGDCTARPFRFVDLLASEDRVAGEQLFSELFDGTRESFQIHSKTGINRALRVAVWKVAGAGGHPDYALALQEELADPREVEQRLRQAERLEAVGRLVGGVAHDFNNLLTGILLYCDLLMATLEPGHRVRKYAEEIRNAGMQATGLVRQLLSVARPTNSEPRLLSLNDIAEGMRNLLVRLIGENIELKFQLDPNLGIVKMDPTQAQQILLNLVLNARDAMPGGGRIAIETCNCKIQVLSGTNSKESAALLPCALFVVSDNGSGMDAVTRDHLFEAFFTTKSGKGTGLGLTTVHDIVSSNGGLIHVDSARGCGTRISVLLPLVPDIAQPPAHTKDFQQGKLRGVLTPNEEG